MARMRQPRAWWSKTVARWKSSGVTAEEFGRREGLSAGTLRWWSYALKRDTRAEHGSSAMEPIEIAVLPTMRGGLLEVVAGGAVVRFESGADVAYVASLVRALLGA
jgi:hypothetical protein